MLGVTTPHPQSLSPLRREGGQDPVGLHTRRAFAILALFLFANQLFAQPDLLSTVGLAHRDATGRDWAYVVWQSPNSSAIAGQTFAVYAKIGPATSTNQYERKAIVARQEEERYLRHAEHADLLIHIAQMRHL